MGIHSIPLELLEQIYRYLDPAFHLHLALVSKHLFKLSRQIIERHRKYYRSYRISSDQELGAVFSQLRAVAADHIAAWHLQTFEGLNHNSERQVTNHASETELATLAETAQKSMAAIGVPPFGISQIRAGNLEALETALLTLSSRVHTIKSIEFFPNPSQDENGGNIDYFWDSCQSSQDYTLDANHNFFCNSIRAFHALNSEPIWPPGFESLRTIIITVPHPDLSPADFERRSGPSAINVAPVFLLPNVNKIYLGGLWINDADIDYESNPWESPPIRTVPASSSVEHLCIERAGNGDQVKHAVVAFVECAKALKTFIVKDCEFDEFDATISILGARHGGSLETMLFDDENGTLRGNRYSKFMPEYLEDYKCVQNIAIDMEDIRSGSTYRDRDEDAASSSSEDDEDDDSGYWELMSGDVADHDTFVDYMQYCMPPTTEVLLLRMRHRRWGLRGGDFRAIASGIIALLEGDIVRLDHLRHIYLDEVVDCCIDPTQPKVRHRRRATDPARARPYFDEAQRVCGARGVGLHLDSGATARYVDGVCAGLFDFELRFPRPRRSET